MLGKLKAMFGGKPSAGGKPRKARVNIDRRFTLVAETAQGSMSKVYRAVDNQSGRSVCLKLQIPEKNQAAAARAEKAERPDEGEIAEKIVHPHVVRTLEHGMTTRGEQYLVMEFIDGVSLQFLRETRAVPRLEEKLELLAQAAEGLAAVHQAGFIHHDIGPRNFLVDRNRVVKLIDLGLAVPNTPAFRKPGNRTGTLNYMAPELIRRETTDERLDIFSFGAMAFEFLTDRLPFEGGSTMNAMLQRINSEPLDPARANPNLPPKLHALLRKLTARRKDDRWPKMSNLAETLRSISVPAAVR
ncbi:MAG: serine/threonine-protein kinase [Isosphaeraceae bacterium]